MSVRILSGLEKSSVLFWILIEYGNLTTWAVPSPYYYTYQLPSGKTMSPALALARSRVMLFSDGNITSHFGGLHSRYRILLGSKKVSSTRYPINWIGKVSPKQNATIRFD